MLGTEVAVVVGLRLDIIDTIRKYPASLTQFAWSFQEIQGSESYQKLSGDSKQALDNLINYLSKQSSPEQKIFFEEGNFTSPSPPLVAGTARGNVA